MALHYVPFVKRVCLTNLINNSDLLLSKLHSMLTNFSSIEAGKLAMKTTCQLTHLINYPQLLSDLNKDCEKDF